MSVRPGCEIAFPPPHAPLGQGGRLGHFTLTHAPTNRRFAQTCGGDHVVEAEEAAAFAWNAEALTFGQRAAVTL